MTVAGISEVNYKTKKGEVKKYTVTYRDIYGKQHSKGLYATRKEAKKHINDFENIVPEVSDITFGQIFKSFQEHSRARYSHTTSKNYDSYFENHLSKLYELKYDKVSTLDLEAFITNIEQEHSPSVAEMCLKIAKSAVNYAMKHKLVKENKFNSVTKVKVPKKPKYHLTEAQERHVLKCCIEVYPYYHNLIYTLMGTGMREGEAFALERGAIDLDNKRILVDKQFTKGKLRLVPKGHAQYRYVYLTEDVVELLKQHIESLTNDTMLVFPNKIGSYISDKNLRERVWKPLLIYAGIKDRVRLHDLRGSYADIALDRGASIKFVQNQLGHAKSQTTLDVYARNNTDMIEKALCEMNGVLKNEM